MRDGIRLCPDKGVYPILSVCWWCGENTNELVLAGMQGHKIARELGQKEVREAVFSMEPCDNCKALQQQGVMLVAVAGHSTSDNPVRTGPMAVVKDEAVKRMFGEDSAAAAIEKRAAFIEDEAWDLLGLPRENINNLEGETK